MAPDSTEANSFFLHFFLFFFFSTFFQKPSSAVHSWSPSKTIGSSSTRGHKAPLMAEAGAKPAVGEGAAGPERPQGVFRGQGWAGVGVGTQQGPQPRAQPCSWVGGWWPLSPAPAVEAPWLFSGRLWGPSCPPGSAEGGCQPAGRSAATGPCAWLTDGMAFALDCLSSASVSTHGLRGPDGHTAALTECVERGAVGSRMSGCGSSPFCPLGNREGWPPFLPPRSQLGALGTLSCQGGLDGPQGDGESRASQGKGVPGWPGAGQPHAVGW